MACIAPWSLEESENGTNRQAALKWTLQTSRKEEAQLSRRARATRYIILETLSAGAQLHEKSRSKRLEVGERHRNCRCSIDRMSLPISVPLPMVPFDRPHTISC